jgi:hypothetical protein
MELTQQRLKELFTYNPDTGDFVRNVLAGGQPAGKVAGMLHKRRKYISIRVDTKLYEAHRLVFLYVHGEWPKGEVDHRNRVRSDNRLANLADVTRAENQQNTPVRKDSVLGVKGVKPAISRGRQHGYSARIQINKRRVTLGTFPTIEEAASAYREAKREMHKHHPEVS